MEIIFSNLCFDCELLYFDHIGLDDIIIMITNDKSSRSNRQYSVRSVKQQILVFIRNRKKNKIEKRNARTQLILMKFVSCLLCFVPFYFGLDFYRWSEIINSLSLSLGQQHRLMSISCLFQNWDHLHSINGSMAILQQWTNDNVGERKRDTEMDDKNKCKNRKKKQSFFNNSLCSLN